jgi:asparagine synthase (glutamine-hydrolysing)
MCGIIGFSSLSQDYANELLHTIQHRGPDDKGIFESDTMTLGHVRLSIQDLSNAGHQPMQYENLVIVFNGEVYNFKEIRKELTDEYTFDSNSDTEVVLKAFHKWGEKAIDKFIGMFAFAIYDQEKKKLWLFRDRVGVKPLFYYHDGEAFVFASELKPIIRYFQGHDTLAISKTALHDFFQFGYISSGNSIFNHCHKLPPGHYLIFENNKIELHQYWSITPFFEKPKFEKSEEELTDELEALLINSFKYRMVSDVPVGIFLSGGIDSSLVAAILQKHYGNINTFTIGFEEAKYNEAEYAKKVAEHLGTTHTEKYLSVTEAKEILDHFVDIYDEPFGDSSGIPTALVSKVAKDAGVKVVLSADGGDEIFCGYERYWFNYNLGKKILKFPRFLRCTIASIMDIVGPKIVSKFIRVHNIEHKWNQLSEMLEGEGWQSFYESMVHNAKNYEIKQLLGSDRYAEEKSFAVGAKEHPMQGMMLWDYHRYMSDDILVKVDRATMYHSIEGREPLLDHRIAEFMAQVPFNLKYKDGTSKYLLRKVLERYLPKELIDRPKMGFGIPMFEWFSSDLRSLFENYLTRERIQREGLLNPEYVSSEYKKFLNGDVLNINKLWFILVFEMWYERYMEKR